MRTEGHWEAHKRAWVHTEVHGIAGSIHKGTEKNGMKPRSYIFFVILRTMRPLRETRFAKSVHESFAARVMLVPCVLTPGAQQTTSQQHTTYASQPIACIQNRADPLYIYGVVPVEDSSSQAAYQASPRLYSAPANQVLAYPTPAYPPAYGYSYAPAVSSGPTNGDLLDEVTKAMSTKSFAALRDADQRSGRETSIRMQAPSTTSSTVQVDNPSVTQQTKQYKKAVESILAQLQENAVSDKKQSGALVTFMDQLAANGLETLMLVPTGTSLICSSVNVLGQIALNLRDLREGGEAAGLAVSPAQAQIFVNEVLKRMGDKVTSADLKVLSQCSGMCSSSRGMTPLLSLLSGVKCLESSHSVDVAEVSAEELLASRIKFAKASASNTATKYQTLFKTLSEAIVVSKATVQSMAVTGSKMGAVPSEEAMRAGMFKHVSGAEKYMLSNSEHSHSRRTPVTRSNKIDIFALESKLEKVDEGLKSVKSIGKALVEAIIETSKHTLKDGDDIVTPDLGSYLAGAVLEPVAGSLVSTASKHEDGIVDVVCSVVPELRQVMEMRSGDDGAQGVKEYGWIRRLRNVYWTGLSKGTTPVSLRRLDDVLNASQAELWEAINQNSTMKEALKKSMTQPSFRLKALKIKKGTKSVVFVEEHDGYKDAAVAKPLSTEK